jgi:hypothetical protein
LKSKSNLSGSKERERDKCQANDDSIGQNAMRTKQTTTKGLRTVERERIDPAIAPLSWVSFYFSLSLSLSLVFIHGTTTQKETGNAVTAA